MMNFPKDYIKNLLEHNKTANRYCEVQTNLANLLGEKGLEIFSEDIYKLNCKYCGKLSTPPPGVSTLCVPVRLCLLTILI